MDEQTYQKLYADFVAIFKKYELEPTHAINFMLFFISAHIKDEIDEEDARSFAHAFYQMILEVNELKKIKDMK